MGRLRYSLYKVSKLIRTLQPSLYVHVLNNMFLQQVWRRIKNSGLRVTWHDIVVLISQDDEFSSPKSIPGMNVSTSTTRFFSVHYGGKNGEVLFVRICMPRFLYERKTTHGD